MGIIWSILSYRNFPWLYRYLAKIVQTHQKAEKTMLTMDITSAWNQSCHIQCKLQLVFLLHELVHVDRAIAAHNQLKWELIPTQARSQISTFGEKCQSYIEVTTFHVGQNPEGVNAVFLRENVYPEITRYLNLRVISLASHRWHKIHHLSKAWWNIFASIEFHFCFHLIHRP